MKELDILVLAPLSVSLVYPFSLPFSLTFSFHYPTPLYPIPLTLSEPAHPSHPLRACPSEDFASSTRLEGQELVLRFYVLILSLLEQGVLRMCSGFRHRKGRQGDAYSGPPQLWVMRSREEGLSSTLQHQPSHFLTPGSTYDGVRHS